MRDLESLRRRILKRRVTEKTQDELQDKFVIFFISFTFIYLENMDINEVFIPSIISSTTATLIIMVDFRTKDKNTQLLDCMPFDIYYKLFVHVY